MPRLSHDERQLCADAFTQWLQHAEQLKQAGLWSGHTGCCYYSEYGANDTFARADGDGKVQLYRRWRGSFNLTPAAFLDKTAAQSVVARIANHTLKGVNLPQISRATNLDSSKLQSAAQQAVGKSDGQYPGLSEARAKRRRV